MRKLLSLHNEALSFYEVFAGKDGRKPFARASPSCLAVGTGSVYPQQATGFGLSTQLDLVLDFGLSTRLDSDTGARKADGRSPMLAALRSAHSYTGATASSGHWKDGLLAGLCGVGSF